MFPSAWIAGPKPRCRRENHGWSSNDSEDECGNRNSPRRGRGHPRNATGQSISCAGLPPSCCVQSELSLPDLPSFPLVRMSKPYVGQTDEQFGSPQNGLNYLAGAADDESSAMGRRATALLKLRSRWCLDFFEGFIIRAAEADSVTYSH
jgi:hypothetical protein